MPYNIKDPEADRLLTELHKITRKSKVEILREHLGRALEQATRKQPVSERLARLRARIRAAGPQAPIDWDELKRRSDEDWGEPT